MSEVDVFTSDKDELDQLLQKVQLKEPDSDDCSNSVNNDSCVIPSQVPLFAAVGSPTDQSLSETSLALDEQNNRVWRPEGGPCQ